MEVTRAEKQRDQILAANLAGPFQRIIDGEEMPLLRSSLIGGHMCSQTKRSDSSSKPCRALNSKGSFDREQMPLLSNGGHTCRKTKRSDSREQTLQGPSKESFDGEEMPLLRSSLNGGHTCRTAKRSDSSTKPCRALQKDHLTVKRCPC